MIRPLLVSSLSAALLASCAAPAPPAPVPPDLTPVSAARVIRDSEGFAEPLWLEIWAHQRGPSARALEAEGMLRFDEQRKLLRLTEGAIAAGAWERAFDEGVPLLYLPVGRRELIEVRDVEPLQDGSGLRRVEFTYRRVPTSVGRTLPAHRSAAPPADGGTTPVGRALLDRVDDRWHVALLEL